MKTVCLYNPEYGTQEQRTGYKVRRVVGWAWTVLVAAAAVGVLVYLIVDKAAWYYYLGDLGGFLVLFPIAFIIFPAKEPAFMEFEVTAPAAPSLAALKKEFPAEKVLHRNMTDLVRGDANSNFSYAGIFCGIAFCECGNAYEPKDISYEITSRAAKYRYTDSGDMYTSEVADLKVTCKCGKCGTVQESCFWNVERPTGSLTRKNSVIGDATTMTISSVDPDYDGLVLKVYLQDKKRHEEDVAAYKALLQKKREAALRAAEKKHGADMKKMEELRAKGWYEKAEGTKETGKKG